MRVGFVAKRGSPKAYDLTKELIEYSEKELGFNVFVESEICEDIQWNKCFNLGVDDIDVVVVIGGDGTLLRALHKMNDRIIPIMTIRMGRRGFLLDVPPFEAKQRLKDLAEGRYHIVNYMRLRASIHRDMGSDLELPQALNEIVIQSWGPTKTKIIRLTIEVDEEELYAVDGDGVIVATPLGSTAYSLAAGGPIVDCELEGIVVTPLAPLQFYAKPVVLAPNKRIYVRVAHGSGPGAVVVDGQSVEVVRPEDIVVVEKSPFPAKIIRFSRVSTLARIRYSL